MIELNNVKKVYGKQTVINNVSFSIKENEMFGIIGHNGAGKSTLFKMMLGLIKPTLGKITFKNITVQDYNFREIKKIIGYLPENFVLYDNLNGIEILKFFAKIKGVNISECYHCLDKVGLANAATKRIKNYSKGMKQRLGFAQALLGKPSLLFLDEPTNGLDPEGVNDFYLILNELLNNEKITVIITSHILAQVQDKISRLLILKNGEIESIGTVEELREKSNLPLEIRLKTSISNLELIKNILQNRLTNILVELKINQIIIQCSQVDKIEVLRLLFSQNNLFQDIKIIEASLEDIFLQSEKKIQGF